MKKMMTAMISLLAAVLLCGCQTYAPTDDTVQTPVVTPNEVIELDPNSPEAILADISFNTPGLTLELGYNKDGVSERVHTYSAIDQAVNAEHYFDYTIKLLTWEKVDPPSAEETKNSTYITLTGDEWTLDAFDGLEVVRFSTPISTAWYRPAMGGGLHDVYRSLREWFDEVEYQPQARAISVPDKGQSYETAAKEYMKLYDQLNLQVTEGSVYKYSYVKSTVSVNQIAKDMTKQRREQGTLGDHEYCFAVETVFVPENDAALAWNMAGNTDLYQGNDPKVPEDAFQKSNCCVIAKLDGEWKMTYIGTSW